MMLNLTIIKIFVFNILKAPSKHLGDLLKPFLRNRARSLKAEETRSKNSFPVRWFSEKYNTRCRK